MVCLLYCTSVQGLASIYRWKCPHPFDFYWGKVLPYYHSTFLLSEPAMFSTFCSLQLPTRPIGPLTLLSITLRSSLGPQLRQSPDLPPNVAAVGHSVQEASQRRASRRRDAKEPSSNEKAMRWAFETRQIGTHQTQKHLEARKQIRLDVHPRPRDVTIVLQQQSYAHRGGHGGTETSCHQPTENDSFEEGATNFTDKSEWHQRDSDVAEDIQNWEGSVPHPMTRAPSSLGLLTLLTVIHITIDHHPSV